MTSAEFPVGLSEYHYHFWPVPGAVYTDRQQLQDQYRQREEERIMRWKEKYARLSQSELQSLLNKELLDSLPRKAVEQLLSDWHKNS